MNDGVDYVPTKSQIVFGHHFSSIAGAGPIIGPVVAASLFGWLPAFLWIVIGSIFIGGVHDMSSMVASIRHEGKSIANVAGKVMSRRAQLIFAAFIWLTLILIVAVFAVVAAKALINKPEIVLPTLMLIPIALLVGYMGFKLRIDTRIGTALGLVLLFAFIYLGLSYPLELPVSDPFSYWVVILLLYAFIASVLPSGHYCSPGTIWLVGLKKPSRYTLYPGIFMLLTTIAALVSLAINLIPAKNYLLGGTVIILLVLSLLVVVETISSWKRIKANL